MPRISLPFMMLIPVDVRRELCRNPIFLPNHQSCLLRRHASESQPSILYKMKPFSKNRLGENIDAKKDLLEQENKQRKSRKYCQTIYEWSPQKFSFFFLSPTFFLLSIFFPLTQLFIKVHRFYRNSLALETLQNALSQISISTNQIAKWQVKRTLMRDYG